MYDSPDIIRVIESRRLRWRELVARMRGMRNGYNFMLGNPKGKRLLGMPRHRWEDNIGMDREEVGWKYVDWIHLAQGRDEWLTLVNTVMNLRVP